MGREVTKQELHRAHLYVTALTVECRRSHGVPVQPIDYSSSTDFLSYTYACSAKSVRRKIHR